MMESELNEAFARYVKPNVISNNRRPTYLEDGGDLSRASHGRRGAQTLNAGLKKVESRCQRSA